jgi:hypothetical protein
VRVEALSCAGSPRPGGRASRSVRHITSSEADGQVGPRGTAITVDGSGFAPNQIVSGSFGAGLSVATLHATADGVISNATVSVPGAAVLEPPASR